MVENLHRLLRDRPAFVPMSEEELDFMRSIRRDELLVEPRQTVFREGEESRHLYTVLDGLGLRYKTVESGGRQVIGFTFPGDFVGLQGGLMGRMGHTFIATTPMILSVFDRADLTRIYATHPERAFDLTWLVATEENVLGELLTTLGQRPAAQSVAWLLLRMTLRGQALGLTAPDGEGGVTMPLPYRQQDVADALGLSLVHTNKTLARLRQRALALWADGLLRIPDLEKLAGFAGTDLARARPAPRPLF